MIFHITDDTLYQQALDKGSYTHPTLPELGFIHASRKNQLAGVIERFMPEVQEVMVLHLVEKRLGNSLKWEEVPDENATFPHIYASIPLEAIEDVSIHRRDAAGKFDFSGLPGN